MMNNSDLFYDDNDNDNTNDDSDDDNALPSII